MAFNIFDTAIRFGWGIAEPRYMGNLRQDYPGLPTLASRNKVFTRTELEAAP
jgi:hypothetical protein